MDDVKVEETAQVTTITITALRGNCLLRTDIAGATDRRPATRDVGEECDD